ncbi:Modification methylase DpnIIB [Gimesia panareensis]|uniref:Methyltransferase n=1 Tax=Gimesia panareensis TaxID=2527978 RepID=A0A518FU04_9PLAN|nr:site-specific DNA-methyltransferase [Gimesia panareensis]QDV19821.1 Modification methylase DpnIIB [Gimesia panareensis]
MSTSDPKPAKKKRTRTLPPPYNELDGKRWIQNSISVWSDIRKSTEEGRLKHPAIFPEMLVERLIETFLPLDGEVILDPFAGSGSTVITAEKMGKTGIGVELSAEYAEIASQRLTELTETRDETNTDQAQGTQSRIHHGSALHLAEYVSPGSVDLCITSPPYWNVLNQRRSADHKEVRHYGNHEHDLGVVEDYEEFLQELSHVFQGVQTALRPGGYCCVIVMDLRKKSRFFPFHSDLAARLQEIGMIYDDLIIWNRQAEYNNLRPLGFPSVFRVNKVHEFILLMQKPKQ